ncbi:MAG TPA: hypothetical protein VJ836_00835 [Candidatus Saccharimonadales bacterium]|nr:hypothetical protein [Candidatus Saccharimonadales bacterium]
MDVKTLALLLLIGRVLSLVALVVVLRKQIRIFRSKPDPKLRAGRIVMLSFVLIILAGNLVPIGLDIAVLMDEIKRNTPSIAGIAYALSSNLNSLFLSYALLALYIIAEKLVTKGPGR